MTTQELRALVEREEDQSLWGVVTRGTPRLVTEIFGDGRKLISLQPLNTRPNYYVVRVHSGWKLSNWKDGDLLVDHLDEIYLSIEGEYGYAFCNECGERHGEVDDCEGCQDTDASDAEWPALDDSVGSSWGRYNPRWLRLHHLYLAAADAMVLADAGGA